MLIAPSPRPKLGSRCQCAANNQMSRSASQKLGTAPPPTAANLSTVSPRRRWESAAATPKVMPNATTNTMAANANWSVAGSRAPISCVTSRPDEKL